jgi:hypothetical protein
MLAIPIGMTHFGGIGVIGIILIILLLLFVMGRL